MRLGNPDAGEEREKSPRACSVAIKAHKAFLCALRGDRLFKCFKTDKLLEDVLALDNAPLTFYN